jgi:hypothetical protein
MKYTGRHASPLNDVASMVAYVSRGGRFSFARGTHSNSVTQVFTLMKTYLLDFEKQHHASLQKDNHVNFWTAKNELFSPSIYGMIYFLDQHNH